MAVSFADLWKDARVRMRMIYGAVLALGVLFSLLILAFTDDVLDSSRQLIRRDLPALSQIAALKVDVMREEALLYDYYATGNRTRFVRDWSANEGRASVLLDEIGKSAAGTDRVADLRVQHERLKALGLDLDRVLSATPVDWPASHRLLASISASVAALQADLSLLAERVQSRVSESATSAESSVRRMARMAILFSMAVFLIAVFVGYYINAYLYESAERRRLAVFAERNPNPVMRLSFMGDVIYANAAADTLARRMGAESPRVLLPLDLAGRLKSLRESGDAYQVWRYEREHRTFESGVHFLPDLGSFHAYVTDVTERRLTEEKLAFQAYHDPVTGLPNRQMFQDVAEQTLFAPEHRELKAGVFLLGLDRFKVVIDTFGHDIGDQVLRAVAARLKSALEGIEAARGATLYHFEGDLYAILAPRLASEQAPVILAEKLLQAVSLPLYVAGREFYASFSIGIALYPDDGEDGLTLLRNADTAMHRVKRQGGRSFQLYKPEMNAMALQWVALENYLRHAIEHEELRLYYQPQIDIRTGRVSGVETLLRWQHPERGLIGPGEFIALAEESGVIVPISEWILRTACLQARAWRDQGVLEAPVSVNVSGRQFHAQNLPTLVASVLEETGLPAAGLELEITESVAMHDVERTTTMLRELKSMGVRIAIDDFGTGFSSLAYLRRFPLDKLKVDQSFVRQVMTDTNDAAILRAVATLGHALKLRVVAEGVETLEQLRRVRAQECDDAQGALYGLPMPRQTFEEWLSRGKRLALS